MNKISIIIPSYNHYKFLKKRLDSIVNQTFKDWEMIIIDDQSNDGSIEILNDFVQENKNKVKHFIINETNSGSGYNSWKKGIELANSEYIWIAETDDYSDENFLEKSIQVLEKKPNCALSFCSSVYVDTDENHLYDSTKRTEQLNVLDGQFKVFNGSVLIDLLPFSTYITNGSSVVFRNTSSKIPDKIFTNKQSSDLFLWTYLLQQKSFVFLNEKLNFFRRHDDSTTTKTSKFNLESVYHEKADYLNYFKQTNKNTEFINHYIKFYINLNKSKIFNISSILKIKNVKYLKLKYIRLLFKFYLNKTI